MHVLRYNGLCDLCSGKLYCEEHGHTFAIEDALLDTAEYLTFTCSSCDTKRECMVMPKSLIAEFHK